MDFERNEDEGSTLL